MVMYYCPAPWSTERLLEMIDYSGGCHLICRVDLSRRKASFTMAQDLIKMNTEAWSLCTLAESSCVPLWLGILLENSQCKIQVLLQLLQIAVDRLQPNMANRIGNPLPDEAHFRGRCFIWVPKKPALLIL